MRVSQDTRTIKKGEWFVAVKGERCDGHKFIPEALRKGAAGVLEEEKLYELAREKIKRLRPEVVAVTGSYGKTTTKEAIAEVLSSKFQVLRTSGNFNTPRGVAMGVVNNLESTTQVFVAEVGMDRLGEIKESCEIIGPRVGVITSVGEMHLEKLGSLENIKKAKSELLGSVSPNGVAVLNGDDANVREIAKSFGGRKVWYGLSSQVDVREFLGRGNQYAALAAYAVGRVFGVPEEGILGALEGFKPPKGRLSLLPGKNGVRIIDDTYNAGPRSVVAALDVLAEFPADRKIVVLGDMLELGSVEGDAHLDVVTCALEVASLLVLTGKRMACAYAQLDRLNPRGLARQETPGVYQARNAQEAVRVLGELGLGRRDVVLVKGSRGMRMEKIVEQLLGGKTEEHK